MPPDFATPPAGIYVHVPFCLVKCRYCDFYSVPDRYFESAWIEAVKAETDLRAGGFPALDTIYFGGGTPSLLAPPQLETLLDRIRQRFQLEDAPEITLEVNPGTASLENLRAYRALGINRLSVGAQSFRDPILKFLGRIHTAGETRETIDRARRAGFDNLGLDLIYGIPGQKDSDWRQDLAEAAALGPEHFSCYMLTIEPGTPLDLDRREGRFRPAGDARLARLFKLTSRFLEDNGYEHYEISNFARLESNGRGSLRSRHNQKYWNAAPYLGLGPSAHSFLPPERSWNLRRLPDYLCALLEENRPPLGGRETLSGEKVFLEALYLGLRQKEGIRFKELYRATGVDLTRTAGSRLERLCREACLTLDQDGCRLTLKGMAVLDSIVGMLA